VSGCIKVERFCTSDVTLIISAGGSVASVACDPDVSCFFSYEALAMARLALSD
jgi:hypothetical protein